MALCLSGRLVRAAVQELRHSRSLFQPSVNEQDERERERGGREGGRTTSKTDKESEIERFKKGSD